MSNLSAIVLQYAAISTVISFFCVEHKDTILNFVSNNAVSKSLLDHQNRNRYTRFLTICVRVSVPTLLYVLHMMFLLNI